jgi:hypothetical protein
VAVLAFGLGLVFGFTFDTTGPRRPGEPIWESSVPEESAVPAGTAVTDDAAPTTVIEGEGAATERIERPTGIPDGETERLVRM